MRGFSINADAGEAAWIVTGLLTRRFFNREHVGDRVYADYCSVFSCMDFDALATTRITDDVFDLVATRPGALRPGHFLPLDKDSEAVIFGPNGTVGFQFPPDRGI